MTPMKRAVSLAREALGSTSPNPAVGAVVVKDGVVLGTGHTQPPGSHHAEIEALRMAGASSQGATLYTTLEPCCTFGRTPPCTQAIIAAGVAEVQVAAVDPNPRVSGNGMTELEASGLRVSLGDEAQAAEELYEAFAKHVNTRLPFVTSKYAMSLDGKIATHSGDSKWVTGPQARSIVQRIRRESDAVMVGINTVLADNPQLTARDDQGKPLARQPLRVVLDSQSRTPPDAQLLREPGHTLIITASDSDSQRIAQLRGAGADVLQLPSNPEGRIDLNQVMVELGQRDIVSLLVEAGGTLQGALFDAGLVDKVMAFIASVIIGGIEAASPVEGIGAIRMAETWRLTRTSLQEVGPDWLATGYPAVAQQISAPDTEV